MAFTMHSHSGQFCPGHAKDDLEVVIKHAISLGYTTMGLTEHMPRTSLEDLYPEELDDPEASLAILAPRHEAYLKEARRLQLKYASQIHLLVGFEGEWLRPAYGSLIKSLASHHCIDYFIGSLHHVNAIPIDYDKDYYARALASCTTTTSSSAGPDAEIPMHERYYDQQHEMLQALRPKVVGHFDLIRLLSAAPDTSPEVAAPSVWTRITRNLSFVASYGGLLECNSSALRKGLAEPYPCRAIAAAWLRMGGRFTLSDDSHGVAQVGTHYAGALDYLAGLGVQTLWTLRREPLPGRDEDGVAEKAQVSEIEVPITDVMAVVRKW
ncbi:histidinol-phosphatase [Xylariaceae sp. FL0016]|nr:histidinol-phosphatase [Xylariaceae sp. FL0016]